MTILFDSDLEVYLGAELKNAKSSIVILSAFLKTEALKWLNSHIKNKVQVTVVSRWQLEDLCCGASDIGAYEYANNLGWKFAINTNMHHKIYLIDNKILFVGSANFTQRGLHLGLRGNDESSVKISPSEIDIVNLDQYVRKCIVINMPRYYEMLRIVNNIKREQNAGVLNIWPKEMFPVIPLKTKKLLVVDLIQNSPIEMLEQNASDIEHDLGLLNLPDISYLGDKERVLAGIRGTIIWKWLIEVVTESDSEFVRFGEITAQLHSALVDDSNLYRKEVKRYLSVIYTWIRYLESSELGIKKFNRTEALFVRD